MVRKEVKTYRGFKQVLIAIAVNELGYDRDEFTQKVNDDEFKEYFLDGDTPEKALQDHERNGL